MNYTTYLFDFDYTLVDSSKGITLCFRNVLNRHGYTQITDLEIQRTIGKTLPDSFTALTGVTDPEIIELYISELVEEGNIHMTAMTRLFPETVSVLKSLKKSGAKIGIISTKYHRRIEELTSKHFPHDFFDIILGGDDVTAAKPSPEGILTAIERLDSSVSETLYVGDSIIDAQAGDAAGVDFAGVLHGVTTARELEEYPHVKIMKSLKELPFPVKEKRRVNPLQVALLVILWVLLIHDIITGIGIVIPIATFYATATILSRRRVLSKKAEVSLYGRLKPLIIRLRTLHLFIIRGRKTPPLSPEESTCLNCGTTFTGNYCPRCSQSRKTRRFQMKNIFQNILSGFFNIDNGFGRTVTDLLYRPGYMIRDFLSGRRAEQFRPFQTLFILAALYFMVFQISGGAPEEKISAPVVAESDTSAVASSENNFLYGDDNLLGEIIEEKREKYHDLVEYVRNTPLLSRSIDLLKDLFGKNEAFSILLIIPLFSIMSYIVFRRKKFHRKYNLAEHIFIQTFIACQILIITIPLLPFHIEDKGIFYNLPSLATIFIFWIDNRQLYYCSWKRSLWATLLMFLLSIITVTVSAIIATVIFIVI